jgi:glutathione S-transferase
MMMTSTSKVIPHLQILGTAWSRAFRNVWMLEELGIPYEIVNVLPASSIVKSYVPSGKIPVLLEYDNNANTVSSVPSFVLYESSAINTYLGDQYGGIVNKKSGSLIPAFGTKERAVYDQTISCITNEIDAQGLWLHRKHDTMKHIYGESAAAVTAAQRNFDIVNQQLATQLQPYLISSTFTAADIGRVVEKTI